MTAELFYDDAYIREFDALITAVDKQDGKLRVALDGTAYYPGGGGQPNDIGWLTIDYRRLSVSKVKRVSGRIWHTLGRDEGRVDSCRARAKSAWGTGLGATLPSYAHPHGHAYIVRCRLARLRRLRHRRRHEAGKRADGLRVRGHER